jgi:hypothetical protein
VEDLDEVIRKTGAKAVVVASQKIPPASVSIAARACGAQGARLLSMAITFNDAVAPAEEDRLAPASTASVPGTQAEGMMPVARALPEATAER